MTQKASEVIERLRGKTLVTAESCTGGGIGALLTAVPGASKVYKGGIISYTNEVKQAALGVKADTLAQFGAVSRQVAEEMALGVRKALGGDIGISVTGLAGPGGDDFGNPVGTVFLGYADDKTTCVRQYLFSGSREEVRRLAMEAAFALILEHNL